MIGNFPSLPALGCKCDGSHSHEAVIGKVKQGLGYLAPLLQALTLQNFVSVFVILFYRTLLVLHIIDAGAWLKSRLHCDYPDLSSSVIAFAVDDSGALAIGDSFGDSFVL